MSKNSKDYEVGYKRPPKSSRFKPGRSGNPKGRPKGSRNFKTDLAEEMAEQISIIEGGRQRKITKQKALIKSLYAKALKGETRAAIVLSAMIERNCPADEDTPSESLLGMEDQALLDNFAARRVSRMRGNPESGPADGTP